MAGEWGTSPLGNLAQFGAPEFRTGTGLADILRLKQLQQEQIADSLTGAAKGIAGAMEQRKKDEMYNVLMDNYSKEYGIANPFAGQGEQGYKAASELIKLRMLAQKQDLAEKVGEARISRIGRASSGGGGGGGGGGGTVTPTGDPNIWEDPVSKKRFLRGPRGGFTPLGGPGGGGGRGGASISESINKGIEKQLGELGTTTEEFGKDIAVPGKVTYWTPDFSKQISTEEARKDPNSQAVLPGGGTMSVGDYGKLGQKYRQAGKYEEKTRTTVAPTATPPPSIKDVGMGGTESTRVIEKNGHHYEVDDVTKTVIRQID